VPGYSFRLVRVRLVNITYSIVVKKFSDIYPGMTIDTCMSFAAKIIAGWPGRKKVKM
jgi:hypothetical protein